MSAPAVRVNDQTVFGAKDANIFTENRDRLFCGMLFLVALQLWNVVDLPLPFKVLLVIEMRSRLAKHNDVFHFW